MEKIRELTANNLRRTFDDLWGRDDKADKEREEILKTSLPDIESMRDEMLEKQLEVIETLSRNQKKLSGIEKEAEKAPEKKADEAQKDKIGESKEEAPEKIEDLLREMHEYVGLETIKGEVESLINMVKVHKLRVMHNLPVVDMSLHMVFSGNPGTGKTMIARLMARIYKSLGILSKGQLVEVDRSGLVAGYVGQTAPKTMEVIKRALGGVLFIDEAYALTYKKEASDFGQEAVDTLLKAMEDNRDDLVVIAAGYDGLMDEFIHSNPGLESRFNRFMHFDDYTIDEMMAIFDMRAKQGGYRLNEDARDEVQAFIESQNADPITFGNARGVRNLFEQILVSQSNRVAKMENVTIEDLQTITEEDVKDASVRAVPKKKRTDANDEIVRLLEEIKAHGREEAEKETDYE
ncbi:MAG: AAA family ATPase [Clostridia bacterium]|nr:AAA family ATPase [Clostridia bacterium]